MSLRLPIRQILSNERAAREDQFSHTHIQRSNWEDVFNVVIHAEARGNKSTQPMPLL